MPFYFNIKASVLDTPFFCKLNDTTKELNKKTQSLQIRVNNLILLGVTFFQGIEAFTKTSLNGVITLLTLGNNTKSLKHLHFASQASSNLGLSLTLPFSTLLSAINPSISFENEILYYKEESESEDQSITSEDSQAKEDMWGDSDSDEDTGNTSREILSECFLNKKYPSLTQITSSYLSFKKKSLALKNSPYFFNRHISIRLCFALACVSKTITGILDVSLGLVAAALACVTLGNFPSLNHFAWYELTCTTVLASFFINATYMLKPPIE